MEEWYLVYTRAGKEISVRGQLNEWLPEAFVPTMKGRAYRWGKLVTAVSPLFPCYVFALIPTQCDLRRAGYTYGAREVVRAGQVPLIVPKSIIEQLKARCAHGPIELPIKSFQRGEPVTVASGAFRGFDAVFEQYLSAPQRVAILLSSLMETSVRVVLPASSIVRN
jgi:transcription antitermination factor NusG